MRLGHLTRPHYANILLLSPSGEKLSSIGEKRAGWYLKKDLAVKLPPFDGYSQVLQLKFTPKRNQGSAFSLILKTNCCVVCGNDRQLTLHHVIPYCIKKYFPDQEKNHRAEWCVLCCENCHVEAEKHSRAIYEVFLNEFSNTFHKHPIHVKNLKILKLFKLKRKGGWQFVPPDRLDAWLAEAGFKSLAEVPDQPDDLKQSLIDTKQIRKALKDQMTHDFIKTHGIEKIKDMFRDAFLKMEPKFLSKGFLEL